MDVPESPEVVAQTVKDLTSLYLRVKRGGGTPYLDGLSSVLTRLADRPGQALQVAFALGDRLVSPMRPEMDLTDPEAGIYFDSPTRPCDGEFVAASFVNMMLRERYVEAEQIFRTIGTEPREVFAFLGLLLALSSS